MSKFEQYKAELISKGMLVAAERLVAPKSVPPVTTPVSSPVSTPDVALALVPVGMLKVFCVKTSCRNFTLQAKGQGMRFFCADHSGQNPPPAEPVADPEPDDDQGPLIHYRGNLYTPHIIADDGVAFRLRNGRAVTMDPSRVEWARRPKY